MHTTRDPIEPDFVRKSRISKEGVVSFVDSDDQTVALNDRIAELNHQIAEVNDFRFTIVPLALTLQRFTGLTVLNLRPRVRPFSAEAAHYEIRDDEFARRHKRYNRQFPRSLRRAK